MTTNTNGTGLTIGHDPVTGEPTDTTHRAGESTRVAPQGAALHVTASGEVIERGIVQAKTDDASVRANSPDILSTARGAGWGSRSATVRDDSTVIVDGMEMSVGAARALGLLAKDGDQYRETGAKLSDGLPVQPSATPVAPAKDIPMLDSTRQLIGQLESAMPGQVTKAVYSMIVNGQLPNDIVQASPVGAESLTGAAAEVSASIQLQMQAQLRQFGIDDTEGFMAFVNESQERRDAFRQALTYAYHGGSAAEAYGPLASAYSKVTVSDPRTIPGVKTRTNPKTGELEVADGMGGYVSLKVARHAGLIR